MDKTLLVVNDALMESASCFQEILDWEAHTSPNTRHSIWRKGCRKVDVII